MSSVYLCSERFTLFAGPEGKAWVDAARDQKVGLRPSIEAYRVAKDGDLVPEVDFCELYGIKPRGAVLVRPDGHVAFRAPSLDGDAGAILRRVLDKVLRRSEQPAGARQRVASN